MMNLTYTVQMRKITIEIVGLNFHIGQWLGGVIFRIAHNSRIPSVLAPSQHVRECKVSRHIT